MSKRLVIVGGVAAGASAAAKARRTTEDIEIVLIEAGPYISFANCGLPYYLGGEIAERDSLFVVSDKTFATRYRVDIRTHTTATGVDPQARTISICSADGAVDELAYDRLILATGSVGVRPPIEGLDDGCIFTVRTVPDVDAITAFLAKVAPPAPETAEVDVKTRVPLRAAVIGGGYIGLETAEQLRARGLEVTIIEMAEQLMLAMDTEMAEPLRQALVADGCEVILGDAVARIVERDGHHVMLTRGGREVPFDIGILAVGAKPSVELARSAGITLGPSGAIQVDTAQHTSDPCIYAAGDNCESVHLVTGKAVNIPLAGPANKAGRVAGANAALDLVGADDDDPTRLAAPPVLGTAIVRVCDVIAGVTGLTEAAAAREGLDVQLAYIPGASHASYYPGSKKVLLKVLFEATTGRLLGAQGVGGAGVDKRIDVLATAISAGMTVGDLEHLDLCYAPPFGSAKDVVILSGFAATNALRGVMPSMTPQELLDRLDGENAPLVLDVRTQREWEAGHLDEAVHLPLDELRERLD